MTLTDAPTAPQTQIQAGMSLADADARLTAPGARFEVATATIRGVETRVWRNATATLRDVFDASLAFGERTFLVYESERVDYAAFGKATKRLARAFADRVARGERIALLLPNTPEWVVGYFAAILAGFSSPSCSIPRLRPRRSPSCCATAAPASSCWIRTGSRD